MVDRFFVKRKVKLIQEDLGQLEKFEEREVADYLKKSAAERLLEKIIMRAIDINQHLIAELGKGNESIRGYEDTFYAIAEFGVYAMDFAKEIAPSAGLRNRLVHEYNDTKEEIIYESIPQAISQYTLYCDYILKFLAKN